MKIVKNIVKYFNNWLQLFDFDIKRISKCSKKKCERGMEVFLKKTTLGKKGKW